MHLQVLSVFQNKKANFADNYPFNKQEVFPMANRFVLNETSYHGAGAIKEIAAEVKSRGFKKCFEEVAFPTVVSKI